MVMSGSTRIRGVQVKPLKVVADEPDWLMEILRSDDSELFSRFGQVYGSATYPGLVKARHYHEKQTDNVACIAGMIKLGLVDMREDSPNRNVVNEFFLGMHSPLIVQEPNRVYHGLKCPSVEPSLVIDVPDEPYNRSEPDRASARPAWKVGLRLDTRR